MARRESEQTKARRRTRIVWTVVVAFGFIALLFALDSQKQKRRAEAEATGSLAMQLAVEARQKVDTNLVEALLLGVAAVDLRAIHETRDNLLRLMRSVPGGLRGFQWGHLGPVWSVVVSPDGKTLATGSDDERIILWDVSSGKPLAEPLKEHMEAVLSVAFSVDGKKLASGGDDGTVVLWDVSSRRPLHNALKGHTHGVLSVAFSGDGKTLATTSKDRTVILWDVPSGKPLGEPLKAHKGEVLSVGFSSDGKTLVSGSDDRTVILWDVASHRPLGEPLTGGTDGVSSIAFGADGKTLVSGSPDGTVILWDTAANAGALRKRACEIVNRNFTLNEWRRYMGERPYRKVCPDASGPGDSAWPFKD